MTTGQPNPKPPHSKSPFAPPSENPLSGISPIFMGVQGSSTSFQKKLTVPSKPLISQLTSCCDVHPGCGLVDNTSFPGSFNAGLGVTSSNAQAVILPLQLSSWFLTTFYHITLASKLDPNNNCQITLRTKPLAFLGTGIIFVIWEAGSRPPISLLPQLHLTLSQVILRQAPLGTRALERR